MSGRARVAIVGAGPIGLEAAIAARELDLDPVVYERGAPGEHIRRWGFVELFSPWRWNATELGLRVLDAARLPRPDPERCPTGRELVDSYLDPLAASLGAA